MCVLERERTMLKSTFRKETIGEIEIGLPVFSANLQHFLLMSVKTFFLLDIIERNLVRERGDLRK